MSQTIRESVEVLENISLGTLGEISNLEEDITTHLGHLEESLDNIITYVNETVEYDRDSLSPETLQQHDKLIAKIEKYITIIERFRSTTNNIMSEIELHISDVNDDLDK